jgi:hypothetical protein
MTKRTLLFVTLAAPLAAACRQAPQAAATPSPPAPAQPTPVPMANKIILYGDMALFAGADNPENCTLRNRFRRGEPVGFRMTAIYPLTGEFAETAELTVKLQTGETIPMRWRGTGDNPRRWLWTAKWVVPENAPLGVIRYTVEARDKEGRTGTFAPFDIQNSLLTIVG